MPLLSIKRSMQVVRIVSAVALLAATASPAAAQVSDSCRYGYYYSNGSCWPYSWYSPPDSGAELEIFGGGGNRFHRGFRRDGFSGGGFHGDGFHGDGFRGGGHR